MPAVLWPNGSANRPTVTSPFGWRIHPVTGVRKLHEGIDLVGWSIIKAPTDGIVTFAGYNGGAGNEVRIRSNGPNAFTKGDVYRLMHNRELWVRAGQSVSQGQDVAVMGTTGSSTGVHCHFETRPGGGAAIDPNTYMSKANAGTSGSGTATPTPKDDEMFPAVLEIKNNSNAGKSLYDLRTGKAIRAISRDENTSLRIAEANGMAVYISVSAEEYKSRGGK